jgi:hypothetical protein
MVDDTELEALASSLSEQPASLDRAWRSWRALSGYRSCDIRSGEHVVRAFRAAALADAEGAAAFARAYAELHALSGEGPRLFFVDRDLQGALSRAVPSLSGEDRRQVEWVLSCVGGQGGVLT